MLKMIGKGIRDSIYHAVYWYGKANNILFKSL